MLLFNNKESNLKEIVEKLESERAELKREVLDLKAQKNIEEETIKHLSKIKDEKRDLEYRKKEMDLKDAHADDLSNVKDEYRDKLESDLRAQKNEFRKMYTEILNRLPNINVKGKI